MKFTLRSPRLARAAAVAATAALLAGCATEEYIGVGFWSSPEARINAAYPASEAVRNSRTSLLESAGEQRKDFVSRYENRMRLRALNCAQGYVPSLFSTAADVRKKIGATTCFGDADADIAGWAGFLRAGLILAKPPLKSVPDKSPASATAEAFISSVNFAAQAPFALVELGSSKGVQVIDLESSRVLFKEPTSAKPGQLSPNGRLFTVGDGELTRIRETETGNVIAEITGVRAFNFHWLDGKTAAFSRSGQNSGEKAVLVDFTTGKEVAVPWMPGGLQRAVAVRGTDNQYVLLGGGNIAKVALDRKGVEPSIALVADKAASGIGWASNTSGATADGSKFFGTSNRELRVLDLATLEIQAISFDPFYPQQVYATPDPDKVIVTGFTYGGDGSRALVMSISKQTVATIDPASGRASRFAYAAALRRQANIADRRLEFSEAPAVQQEVTLAQFVADAQDQVNQRKLASFDRATGEGLPTSLANGAAAAALAAADAARQAAMAAGSIAPAPMADLARSASVEAVGVYQGSAQGVALPAGARRVGTVQVRVRRSSKPVVLVLSSYEPVRWIVSAEPGARVAAILRAGNEQSQVMGGGGARVVSAGNAYAYKPGSAEYFALNRDVVRLLGRGIEARLFQGQYEGGQFSVGGN